MTRSNDYLQQMERISKINIITEIDPCLLQTRQERLSIFSITNAVIYDDLSIGALGQSHCENPRDGIGIYGSTNGDGIDDMIGDGNEFVVRKA